MFNNISKKWDMTTRSNAPTVNPYLYAGKLVVERLLWDLQLKAWLSKGRIKKLKNTMAGNKAVIVCNGPSLLNTDFSLLDNVYTFGLNKINLLFDKSSFRPSCVVAVNRLVIDQNKDFYNSSDIPLFLDSYATKHVKFRRNVIYIHSASQNKFAKDCSMSVSPGHTVTYTAMQLAFHMGFEKVSLVGCDHSFATKGAPNKVVESAETDPNHFDPNYFAGGVKWQLPDLTASEVSYSLAKEAYCSDGRKIINCTEGGLLEIFPRMSLNRFING